MKNILKLVILFYLGIVNCDAQTVECYIEPTTNKESDKEILDKKTYIEFTTSKQVGSKIELHINAKQEDERTIWIDLNGNGEREEDEKVHLFGRYISVYLKKRTFRIYGKVIGLICCRNGLTSLNVSKNTYLEYLDCKHNQLTNLDISKNSKLDVLRCSKNQLKNIDVSKNTNLRILECRLLDLTSLDIANNINLESLNCSDNQLVSLDVTKNPKLKYLFCSENKLENLNISNNINLLRLSCFHNELRDLDVSNNDKLEELICFSNHISCVKVSDKQLVNSDKWLKSLNTIFSTNCKNHKNQK